MIDPRKGPYPQGLQPEGRDAQVEEGESRRVFERTCHRPQPGRVCVLVAQGQVWRRSRGKDAPATEASADPEKHLLQPAVVVKLHAPDACPSPSPSPSARYAALPRSAQIPASLQPECMKERPNRRNRGRHGTAKTASSRTTFTEMDNALQVTQI